MYLAFEFSDREESEIEQGRAFFGSIFLARVHRGRWRLQQPHESKFPADEKSRQPEF
jgi:hypothetical protein